MSLVFVSCTVVAAVRNLRCVACTGSDNNDGKPARELEQIHIEAVR